MPSFFVLEQIISLPVADLPVAPSGEQNAPGVTKFSTVVGAAVVDGGLLVAVVVGVDDGATVEVAAVTEDAAAVESVDVVDIVEVGLVAGLLDAVEADAWLVVT